jgi:hypothetical protein
MAHQATERAGLASIRAEEAIEESIVRIAKEMSRALLAESQKWLVLKQTERNRREAFDWPHGSPPRLWPFSSVAVRQRGGGVRGRARPVRPCWRRSIAVGLSR